MSKRKRIWALWMSLVLLLTMMPAPAFAEDAPTGVINISGDSDWHGSVFGSVGGQDKITSDNFTIAENEDGTVTLRSANDRGKISGSVDGIAYYFKEVPSDTDFELTATATVDAWKTGNNQVSFGLMLRDKEYDNISDDSVSNNVYGGGNFIAAGAVNQKMEGFSRSGSDTKLTEYALDGAADAPAVNNVYNIDIKKSGSIYVLKVGDATATVSDYAGAVNYAGLFTARNTTVTYSDVHLNIEGAVDLGDWAFSRFGTSTNDEDNPPPTKNDDGSITMTATNGKVSQGAQGISFYYKEVPADTNFDLKTKATVVSFDGHTSPSTPKQKSFGLMLKGEIGTSNSNLVAVGALDTVIEAVYQQGGDDPNSSVMTKTKLIDEKPAPSDVYDLEIQKSGDVYTLTANGQSEVFPVAGLFGDPMYAGLYVARDAEVTFSDFSITVATKLVDQLIVDDSAVKKEYLIGESLDLSGLSVTAKYSDGSTEVLTADDYVASGFDSSTAGTDVVTINYGGKSATINMQIDALDVTHLGIKYFPAKTVYYPGDKFDPAGFVVEAEYNDGYQVAELTSDLYTFSIADATLDGDGFIFNSPGTAEVVVTSTETPSMSIPFDVEVKDAAISSLEIRHLPALTNYFIGDAFNPDGMVVYAKYSDGAEIRLDKDEYALSALDSATAGEQTMTVSFKGKTADFNVNVKEKQLVGIEISQYPKTTYAVGDSFDPTGMVVSKVYDSGDREALSDADYTVDSSAFDSGNPGEYGIAINPNDTSITPITLNVTVRAAAEYEWQPIIFGQSIKKGSSNTVAVEDDGTIKLTAKDGGGKITGDHDGISFYYTVIDAAADNFVLSADIKVDDYGKQPSPDGQESFGIMARDAIGQDGDSSVFASNIAAVGGYSGGTKNPIGTQLFVRTGVTTPDGAGSNGVQAVMLQEGQPNTSNTYPAQPYRLTLAKTNSGYTGQLNDGDSAILFTPDILNVQDSKIYVGFFAARYATIEVSNIDFKVTSATTDPAKVEPPQQPTEPGFDIVSLDKTPETAYSLMIKPNVNGTVTVKQGNEVIAQDQTAAAGQILSVPATLGANGDTNFSLTFLPDDTQFLTSYDKIVRNFTVTVTSYSGDIYVSPTGTSGGTGGEDSPLDLDTAIQFVKPGQKIIMLAGTYVRDAHLDIMKYNDGTENAMKSLVAAPGARPVVDFNKKTEGVLLSGDYWHVQGIDFTNTADNTKGFTIGGNHNIVEDCKFYANGDTGMQISRTDVTEDDISEWPSYNLILNSESYDNHDPSNNNADGFAAKLTSGVGNVFRGDISHNNIDDGWDLYTKAGSGAIGPVTIEDSISYDNGTLTDGTVGSGDKNGFKLGGEGIKVAHTIRDSIAFDNGAAGFTSNSNPGVIAENNIGFNNAKGNLVFTTYTNIEPAFTINGFVSYQKDFTAKDQYPAELSSDANYMFDGTVSMNKSGVKLSDANFASLEPSLPYERDEDGNIVRGDFLRFLAPAQDTGDSDSGSGSGTQTDDGANLTVTAVLTDGTAQASLDSDHLDNAFAQADADANGAKRVQVAIPATDGAKAYGLSMPASFLSSSDSSQQIEISTAMAKIALPGGLLRNAGLTDAGQVSLTVTAVDTSDLPDRVRDQIGDHPVIAFDFTADGGKVAYDNPDAPVSVAIPYQPTAEELKDPEHITVWYVDGAGNAIAVPSGKYDANTGTVTFTTSHFSSYAVVYVHKSFEDLEHAAWAREAIEVMASKGVISGVSSTAFAPGAAITRADFALLLVKALGLHTAVDSGFPDVVPSDYYYEAAGIARTLGIISGREDGLFYPKEPVSRQDMFVMTAKALEAAGVWKAEAGDASALNAFADGSRVSGYAAGDLAAMVKAGLIAGDAGNRLNPLAHSTRAEAAMMIYRIYNLQ